MHKQACYDDHDIRTNNSHYLYHQDCYIWNWVTDLKGMSTTVLLARENLPRKLFGEDKHRSSTSNRIIFTIEIRLF